MLTESHVVSGGVCSIIAVRRPQLVSSPPQRAPSEMRQCLTSSSNGQRRRRRHQHLQHKQSTTHASTSPTSISQHDLLHHTRHDRLTATLLGSRPPQQPPPTPIRPIHRRSIQTSQAMHRLPRRCHHSPLSHTVPCPT